MRPPGRGRSSGLFIEIFDWMLAPLVVLWPAAVLGTYFVATAISESTYDADLGDHVAAVIEEASAAARRGEPPSTLPIVEALRRNPVDRFRVQVARLDGTLVAGDELPQPVASDARPSQAIHFRDGYEDGDGMRIAYAMGTAAGSWPAIVVQVAEPLQRRRGLIASVTAIVMVVVVLLMGATVALVWLGLRRGLQPLLELRAHIERRSPGDLSPLPLARAPLEIEPLLRTLNAQLERVRASLESQRRFVADAAHQLRTPLAGLKTQAETARRATTLDQAHERAARIEEGVNGMARLVARLLALARADDALQREVVRVPVALNGLLRELCAAWADSALGKGVAIAFEPAHEDLVVGGEAVLLRELFANLVDNAIRYTPPGGEVAVRVLAGPPASVVVEDTGIGIPEAERSLVFERFHRVLGNEVAGSGLGLAIVKAIADAHGAVVRVEAGPQGRGSMFQVMFPRENP